MQLHSVSLLKVIWKLKFFYHAFNFPFGKKNLLYMMIIQSHKMKAKTKLWFSEQHSLNATLLTSTLAPYCIIKARIDILLRYCTNEYRNNVLQDCFEYLNFLAKIPWKSVFYIRTSLPNGWETVKLLKLFLPSAPGFLRGVCASHV